MMEILPKTQLEIQEKLQSIAEKHAARSNGFLVPLPTDPNTYPGQSLFNSVIKSSGVLGPNEADSLAAGIDERYLDLMGAYDAYAEPTSKYPGNLQHIIEAVGAGTNIVNGTDHMELIDIIFNHLHFTNRIKRAQHSKAAALGEKPEKHNIRTAVIVSKMIDWLGIETGGLITPARDLLGLGFDKTYLTIPRTSSTERGFEKTTVKAYNRHVRKEIESDFEQRAFSNRHPIVLGVALPGTINKQSSQDPDLWVVGKVNEGLIGFMKNALTVLSAVRMRENGSEVFIDSLPVNIHTSEQLHQHVGRLLVGLTELDGKKYIYDHDGSIAVIEPRNFRTN